MTAAHDGQINATLQKLLAEHSLDNETRLYREVMRDTLMATDMPGVYRIVANASPSESVVDVYGNGYVMQAEQVGAGLAFAQTATPNWQETMEMKSFLAKRDSRPSDLPNKLEVEVRLADILEQGGLIYPVESVSVERAWYCTLPASSVEVREAM